MKKIFSTLCLSALVSLSILSCQKDEGATPLNNSSLANAKKSKVTICHKPDGKNPHTIEVDDSAVAAHLAHGDAIGECGAVVTPK